jgi:hypothetical protein
MIERNNNDGWLAGGGGVDDMARPRRISKAVMVLQNAGKAKERARRDAVRAECYYLRLLGTPQRQI